MSQGTQTLTTDEAQEIRDAIVGRQVCPFCGAVMEQQEGACPRCTMENTSASRQATKSRIGPWYVLQTRNPAAPGMKFETLLGFVRKGRVKPKSVVRGPTTHQLWRFAAHVKGLSREFGVCYSCGGAVEHTAALCPHCNRSQDPPLNPDSFLEGLDQPALPGAKLPLYRELESPMVAEDIAAPSMPPAHSETQPSAGSHAAAPDTRTVRKNTDGFLTAQDLAAAFKLDFQPKGRRAQQQPQKLQPVRPKSRRKRHVGRYLFLLLLLGGGGTAGYELYQDPALRQRVFTQASEWYQQASAWAQQKWTELHQTRPAKPAAHESVSSVLAVEPPSKPAKTEQAQPATAIQLPAAPAVQPSPAADKANPWDQLYQQPSSAAPASSSAPAEHSSARHYRQGSRDDVWALYTSAMDAEAQGDYRAAVRKYEQIKDFSPDTWPRDLELRLKEARQQVQ